MLNVDFMTTIFALTNATNKVFIVLSLFIITITIFGVPFIPIVFLLLELLISRAQLLANR